VPGESDIPRVGVLGGGQLAQRLTLAATELGVEVVVFERAADSPAGRIAGHEIVADWADPAAQQRLLALADVVTLENEFVDADVLEALARGGAQVRPGAETLRQVQDKLAQKRVLAAAGLPVAPFRDLPDPRDLASAAEALGWPLIVKARYGSYDGYGNALVREASESDAACRGLGWPGRTLMVEGYVPFARELAVMLVRGVDGEQAAYPVVETVQRNHICHEVIAPAAISAEAAERARALAGRAAEAVGVVGALGVELFLLADDSILVNELAPRPHNSGHYTIEGCETSQFEQHLRAVLGWPLGSTRLLGPAAMVNLLGTGAHLPRGLADALAVPGAHVHLYGKRVSRPGRTMGHVTALGDDVDDALARARAAAAALEV
jgi:5-(carboxyamino)imidazole ribonucleotide synthase